MRRVKPTIEQVSTAPVWQIVTGRTVHGEISHYGAGYVVEFKAGRTGTQREVVTSFDTWEEAGEWVAGEGWATYLEACRAYTWLKQRTRGYNPARMDNRANTDWRRISNGTA